MAAPPIVCPLMTVLYFCGNLDFLHKHSWLWTSSLLSSQALSLQPTAVLFSGLLSNPTFQHTAHVHTGDTRLRLRRAGLWHGPSV